MLYNIKIGKLNIKRSFRVSNNDFKMEQCTLAERSALLQDS